MLAAAPAHVKAAVQQSIVAHRGRADFHVLPECWHAVKVFEGMGSQWRVIPGPRHPLFIGLDYAALPVVLAEKRRIAHRQPLDVLMPQLRFLEAEARSHLNRH